VTVVKDNQQEQQEEDEVEADEKTPLNEDAKVSRLHWF